MQHEQEADATFRRAAGLPGRSRQGRHEAVMKRRSQGELLEADAEGHGSGGYWRGGVRARRRREGAGARRMVVVVGSSGNNELQEAGLGASVLEARSRR